MIEKTGDLFTTKQVAIGHGVNTKGVMGAGIAKKFREYYVQNFLIYTGQCDVNGLLPGGCLIVPEKDFGIGENHINGIRLVCNLASQRNPGPDAQYLWLYDSVTACVDQLMSLGVNSMALPQIGCGIGGLDWPVVRGHLRDIETNHSENNFEFEVWSL